MVFGMLVHILADEKEEDEVENELELELILSHMTHKPMLRGEVKMGKKKIKYNMEK